MVSLWPFRSQEDAASFEKTLSTLTAKLSRAAARNDNLRQRSRRVRVMWTLYAGFAYILAALLLTLVTGWRNWGATEISVVAGGPVLIYIVRTSLTTYYDYRISSTEAYLKTLTKERDATIERLKEATKYNSTQQLLEKYSTPPKPKGSEPPSSRRKSQGPQKPAQPQGQGQRTGIAPPATANIPRPANQRPITPQRPASADSPQGPFQPPGLPPPDAPAAEFAPNAFTPAELTRQYSSSAAATYTQSHWYDRILDALLGEDETQPKNRLALICNECRLVNGQAPPGTRALEDVGWWRCSGCGAWNGKEKVQEDAVADLVKGWETERKSKAKDLGGSTDGGVDSDNRETEDDAGLVAGTDEGSGVDVAEESVDETPPPSKSTRSKTKGKGKK
ncbi:hypothetical protein BU26DRAFT_608784 [Trematosphaeria pertusa]|uniref:Endoplasmic reticulum junction formation protein lunapark n=1 Tax=Trematosphaeria pertusa TaxID=390896 RepID=A0A6A6I1G9_9PLEO|nr:uncharacterized protein BU26DRAFT_608784 [Trematosphaeria pertusa]KAF2244344.1 hypothetical protein BU26DRAFT_608784 [Trematosphaeria pertusa]